MFPVRLRGLAVQLVGLIVVPMVVLLLIVAYGGVSLHDHAMRSLVSQRDERAVRAAADALADRFAQRQLILKLLAERIADGARIDHMLHETPDLRRMFDGGLVAVDAVGNRIDSWQPDIVWATDLGSTGAAWILDHKSSDPMIIANIQIAAQRLALFGAMSLTSLNVPATLSLLQNNPQTRLYLVADDGHLLYPPEVVGLSATALPELSNVPIGTDGHQGQDPDAVIVASRIDRLNWTLAIREPWNEVINSTLKLSLVAPLAVIPAVLLAVFILIFGFMRVVLPIRRLSRSAGRLAWGDYDTIRQPVGGVQEIRDLQITLSHMAGRLQQAQAGMHSYIGAMLQGQEDERKRIARELHDDTLQALIALDQQRQMAQRYLERDPAKAREHLSALQTMLDQNIDGLRGLIRAMRPPYLEDLGLVPALEMLCEQYPGTAAPRIAFEVSGSSTRLSPDQELALYRIAQEAVSNAIRHAGAGQVNIHLGFGDKVTLSIVDDGQGFKLPERPGAFAQAGHFGLMGMVERAEQVGAQLRIDSQPGKGSAIQASLPRQGKT